MSRPLVLIAEDESLIAMLYAEALGAEGYQIRLALETGDAQRSIRAELPAVAVVDLRLREGDDGRILAEALARRGVPVVISSAYVRDLPRTFLERVRPAAVLQKPIAPTELVGAIRAALRGAERG
jgi:two-component system, OmpR family, response regulator AdeR